MVRVFVEPPHLRGNAPHPLLFHAMSAKQRSVAGDRKTRSRPDPRNPPPRKGRVPRTQAISLSDLPAVLSQLEPDDGPADDLVTMNLDSHFRSFHSWRKCLGAPKGNKVDKKVIERDREMRKAEASCFWRATYAALHDDEEAVVALDAAWETCIQNAKEGKVPTVQEPVTALQAAQYLPTRFVHTHDPVVGSVAPRGARGVIGVYLDDHGAYRPHWLPMHGCTQERRELTVHQKRLLADQAKQSAPAGLTLSLEQTERLLLAKWVHAPQPQAEMLKEHLQLAGQIEEEAEGEWVALLADHERGYALCQSLVSLRMRVEHPMVLDESVLYEQNEAIREKQWLVNLMLEHPWGPIDDSVRYEALMDRVKLANQYLEEQEIGLLMDAEVPEGFGNFGQWFADFLEDLVEEEQKARRAHTAAQEAEYAGLIARRDRAENDPLYGWRSTLADAWAEDPIVGVWRGCRTVGKFFGDLLCAFDEACPSRTSYAVAIGREAPPPVQQLFAPEWRGSAVPEGANALAKLPPWRAFIQETCNSVSGVARHALELGETMVGQEVQSGDLVYRRHACETLATGRTDRGAYAIDDVHSIVCVGASYKVRWFDCLTTHDVGVLEPVVRDVCEPFDFGRHTVLRIALVQNPVAPRIAEVVDAMPSETAAVRALYAMCTPHLPVEVQAIYRGGLSEHIGLTNPASLCPIDVARTLVDVDSYLATLPTRVAFNA